VFVDHGLRLLFSIRFGIAVSPVVRLVRGRGGVGGDEVEPLNVPLASTGGITELLQGYWYWCC